LTVALGYKSVRAAQRGINSREFAEWKAFDLINPIGGNRQDYNAALIAATFANVMGAGKYDAQDFLLKYGPRTKPDAEDIERRATIMANRINSNRKIKEQHGRDR